MSRENIAYFLLRLGLAFSFIYAAVAAWFRPEDWVGWFPPFIQALAPQNVLLMGWGIVQIILGLWILSGKKIFIPTLLGALSMAGIAYFNLGSLDIVFRDITIGLVLLSLAISSYGR